MVQNKGSSGGVATRVQEEARTMPHREESRRCAVTGCRAWAKRGETVCSAHLRARVSADIQRLFAPLLGTVQRQAALVERALAEAPAGGDAVQWIDAEIMALQRARVAFLRWIAPPAAESPEVPAEAEAPAPASPVGPAQFLRVWNDSSGRLLRLIEARQRLGSGGGGTLVQVAYRLVEEEDRRLALEAGQR